MIKKALVLSLLLFIGINTASYAQDGYGFEVIAEVEATPVKNQYASSTCWSFTTSSFIESEMLRLGKEEIDLSEMFVVRNTYSEKALRYVRLHGKLNFAGGGALSDVMHIYATYGAVPNEVYPGLLIGEANHRHGEMDEVLSAIVNAVIKNKNKKLSPVWHNAFLGALDAYLGEYPETFKYKGKKYTPKSFADDVVGINPNDYVELTSFTHHPYYSTFPIEVPDNWRFGHSYNLPLDELIDVLDNALKEGYSASWAADVSEDGFSYKNGLAIVPEQDIDEMTAEEKENAFNNPVKQKRITAELRQTAYDNYQTTDDHAMHITGMAKASNGDTYYLVKNSWGTDNTTKGYLYASLSYMQYKTLSIYVHKDAIPEKIRKKLNL